MEERKSTKSLECLNAMQGRLATEHPSALHRPDLNLETVSPSGMVHRFSLGIVGIPPNRAMDRSEEGTKTSASNLGILHKAAGDNGPVDMEGKVL